MKTSSPKQNRGITLVEVLIVIAIVAVLVAMLIPGTVRDKPRPYRITCVNNLKQIALPCRVWEGDNSEKYPPMVSQTNGGTMEFSSGPNVWRHFQAMSNELNTPLVLICPADKYHSAATNFINMCNSNVSFFFGVDASETNPQMILSGDHNITNGTPIQNGLLNLTTNKSSGWTAEVHNKVGQVALSDGSVQMLSIAGLRAAVGNTGLETNRLQMPILEP